MKRKIITAFFSLTLVTTLFTGAALSASASAISDTPAGTVSERYIEAGNTIQFLGYKDHAWLTIEYSDSSIKATASGTTSANWAYYGQTYVDFEYYDSNDNLVFRESITGRGNGDVLAQKINEQPYQKGSYFVINHREMYTRLRISRNVISGPDFSSGSPIDASKGRFYIGGEFLEYATDKKSDLLSELEATVQEAKKYTADAYTPSSYERLQDAIKMAEKEIAKGTTNVNLKELNELIQEMTGNLEESNVIVIKGYYDREHIKIYFDYANKKLKTQYYNGTPHPKFGNQIYCGVDVIDDEGNVKASVRLAGNEHNRKLGDALNDLPLEKNDHIVILHKEADTRLKVSGTVENSSENHKYQKYSTFKVGDESLILENESNEAGD